MLPAGFLKDYAGYARQLTDAPAEFHIFTALTALGAAAARVRVPFGSVSAPPALWTVLVAPSAFYRKTTAMELGRRLLAAACPDVVTPMLYRYDAVHWHIQRTERLLAVDQFTELLTNDTRERLLEHADAHAPLAILAGASTAHLSAQVAGLDIASGFLSRFLMVAAEQKTTLLGAPGAQQPQTEARLVAFLQNASRLEGVAQFDGARKEFQHWGRAAARWIGIQPGATPQWETAAGLASRMELTLLKLATLVEIACSGTLNVTAGSMRLARELEHFARRSFARLMNREIGKARQFHQELRVLGIVRRHPGITRRRLQQNSHLDAGALERVLLNLAAAGAVGRNKNRVVPAVVTANTANGHPLEAP